jgi:hypothetical protein
MNVGWTTLTWTAYGNGRVRGAGCAELAHDPRMIEILLRMADEAESDANELDARDEIQVPLPRQR